MIAGFAILPVMPLDLVFREVVEGTFADAGVEVLFGMLQWQTERTVFGFVESRFPGFGGEGGGRMLEGRLVWFFGFEEFGHDDLQRKTTH
jgi:hypothetical protein